MFSVTIKVTTKDRNYVFSVTINVITENMKFKICIQCFVLNMQIAGSGVELSQHCVLGTVNPLHNSHFIIPAL